VKKPENNLKNFLEPESVAIVGVSRQTGPESYNILENLLGYDYRGKIYPVNPRASQILGVKTYASIGDIKGNIDQAIISLPRSLVPRAVKECADKDVRAIVIVSQGFADADDEGKSLQKEIDEIIQSRGVRILGPNSLGTSNSFINFSSSFVKLDLPRVPVTLICQTGSLFGSFDLRVGKFIDLGNTCDIDMIDCLDYCEQDQDTRVAALHIEGLRNGKGFIEAVSRLARKKPVIALKTGTSEQAALAVQSHSGSLAGRDEIWQAALKQSGVLRVSEIQELRDSTRAFSRLPLMKGNKVGIISISGGLGVIAFDTICRSGLELAAFSPSTLKRISGLLPAWQGVNNPIDLWPGFMVSKQPFARLLSESLDSVLADAGVDGVLFMWAVRSPPVSQDLEDVMSRLARVYPGKPIVCCFTGDCAQDAEKRLDGLEGTLAFSTPERAVKALGYLARYSAFQKDRQE
jgi:acetate---CoA ligase (ADP-forming)